MPSVTGTTKSSLKYYAIDGYWCENSVVMKLVVVALASTFCLMGIAVGTTVVCLVMTKCKQTVSFSNSGGT